MNLSTSHLQEQREIILTSFLKVFKKVETFVLKKMGFILCYYNEHKIWKPYIIVCLFLYFIDFEIII